MPYKLNEAQYKAVVALSDAERCSHFIGKVADSEFLWGVRNDDGWLVPVTPDKLEYFPVWPHSEYAQKIADKHFPGHVATEIELDDFMGELLPRLQHDGAKVAVFPNEEWNLWITEPSDLREALADEISKFE
ncbi:DUF2750 domain-containing protein [Prosthecobacter sp.]|uniref:DUF2750 domain-containing protein n=1 Tax=Prosthecobacter sp. TaxID=1965333 RepID=UPI002AB995B4|nr:DUF2750 domain-containing protein [Prosthecobacter sp.]MDZ4404790.1 DUF2750 domain-containing protein [Prosthecobacter sp.]